MRAAKALRKAFAVALVGLSICFGLLAVLPKNAKPMKTQDPTIMETAIPDDGPAYHLLETVTPPAFGAGH